MLNRFLLTILLSIYGYDKIIKNHFQKTDTDYDLRSLWSIGLGNLDEHSITEISFCDFKFVHHDSKKWVKLKLKIGESTNRRIFYLFDMSANIS